MALADISRPEFVLRAIDECDRLGRWRFLSKYGYDASRRYLVGHNGGLYDSKAIIGVAHKYARPRDGALRPDQFSGGVATVVSRLRHLGFVVEEVESAIEEVPLGEAVALALVENEATYGGNYDHWNDLTGVEYHFPNMYKNRVIPGRPVVYYRGVRRADGGRGQAGYFGIGRIGEKWPDPGNDALESARDWTWHCSIVDYLPFKVPVPPPVAPVRDRHMDLPADFRKSHVREPVALRQLGHRLRPDEVIQLLPRETIGSVGAH